MVDTPPVVAVLKRSQDSAPIEVGGQLAQERLQKQISLATALSSYYDARGGRLEIIELPRQHAGFGTGTQIACAAASLIKCQWMATAENGFSPIDAAGKVSLEKVWESSTELIQWSGRGKRSTIGAFGFLRGGFIVDQGHNDQGHGQLGSQLDVLEPLTVVLATPIQNLTISGSDEDRMMSVVASQPNPHRQEMWDLIRQAIVPAASEKRWDVFGNALHEYGKLAGVQFARIQGGIYRNDQVADLIARMQSLGLRGVCQSSWGPTAFGLSEDSELASRTVYQLKRYYGNEVTIELTHVKNRGAEIVLLE